jgi:uncharacterized protein (DUF885 family)
MTTLTLRACALATGLLLLAGPVAAQPASPTGPGAASTSTPGADAAETQKLHALFERQWEETARLLPEFATLRGDHRFGDRLADVSEAGLARRDALVEGWLAEARRIDAAKLSRSDRLSLEMFIHNQQRFVDQRAFPGYRGMTLRALGGPQSQFSDLLGQSPVNSRERIEQMLARLAAFPRRMDEEIAQLRRSAALGWVPGRDVLLRVQAQLDAQLAGGAEDMPHFAPFKRLPGSLPAEQRAELRQRGAAAVAQHVVPAMRRLRTLVADELLPKAPADGSLARYPDGRRVYEMLVRQNTTTELSAQQIHDTGLRELARLRAEMDKVRVEVKFGGSFGEFAQHLNTDPRYFHTSAEAMLAGLREIAKRLDAEMPKLFAELPRAPYGIVPMPAFMGNRAEYYNGPALDGSRAGFFFANVLNLNSRPKWAMETLTAHETVPGHHMQIARATELRDLPAFRRSGFGITAFSEGWALYAETLGFEMGLYVDPLQRWGHLQWQAFRAGRLVVDTGIHALGWSRERAIDFLVEQTGVNREFVASEVDRYTSQPGQALAYMIGKLEFDRLRDKARAALGTRFDIRRFHNAVLDNGALPLPLLERVVDDWIATQRTS